MSIQTASLASNISTTSVFQSVVAAHRGMFAAIGLVRVPFTGEIDPSTVAAPTTASTIQGYEIWRFNDALQATAPVYLKVGYGNAASATLYRMTVAVGSGHDGSGNLTGATPAAEVYVGGASTTSYPTYVAGDSGRVLIRLWPTVFSSNMMLLSVERLPGADGLPSAEGVVVWSTGNSTSVTQAHCMRTSDGRVDSITTGYYRLLSSAPPLSSGASGTDVALYPARAWLDRRETRPLHSLLTYFQADLTPNNPVTVACWDGRSRTYLPLGTTTGGFSVAGGSQCAALLWE